MKNTFEQLMAELDEIVNQLESDSLPLEDSVQLYKKGQQLIKSIKQVLDNAKEVFLSINENNSEEN